MEANLSWPECLGEFDEESCRFFLRELGSKIVQFYPFSVGMDEVYTQILTTYGQDGAADALSVLHELLEDDSVALGSGDDGDIWRSWRHSWRHRNDDHLNPYLPRIRGRLLPPPTAIRTRLLRNANFLAEHRSYSTIEHVSSSRPHDPLDAAIQRVEDERGLLIDRNASQNLPNPSIQSPRRSLPAAVTKFPFPQVLLTPQRRVSIAIHRQRDGESPQQSPISVTVDSPPRCIRPSRKEPGGDQSPVHVREQSEIAPLTTDNGEPNISSSDISEDDIPRTQTTTCTRRYTHRQARLIDGALFQVNGGAAKPETPKSRSPVKVMLEKTTKRLSVHTARQQSQRDSWIHNIWTRFRGDYKQRHSDCSKHSALATHPLDSPEKRPPAMTPSQRRYNRNPSEMQQVLPPLTFGYDGTAEHNNKPLPLSPADFVARQSLSSDTQRQFFQIPVSLHGSVVTSPPVSAASSGIDRFCQKLEFDGLVSATMRGPQELSPMKITHESCSTESPRPSSFSSIAGHNPYVDVSPTSNAHPTSAPNHRQHTISSDIWPVRSNMDTVPQYHNDSPPRSPRRPRLSIDDSSANLRGQAAYDREREIQTQRPTTPETPTKRGRRGTDTSTPSRTRSRSPMKRILGMMKSMSTNQIPSHKSTPTKDSSPQSNSKNKWRDLSHKMKHGFLSADAEQLEQEELMEQHNYVSIVSPQPKSRRPAIISLDTAVQSRAYQELELLIVDSANLFLLDEYEHGRLTRESVLRSRRNWEDRNRPRVLEFIYDMQTQYDLIMTNLRTLKLYGEHAEDMIKLNSTLQQWRIMIREWPVKTLCMPDSVIRRWLQDTRRVLELIGASAEAMTCMDNLTISVYQVIRNKEHLRSQLRNVSNGSTATVQQRSFSDGQSFNIFQQGLGPMPLPLEPNVPPMPTFESSRPLGNRQKTPYEKSLAQIKQLETAGAEAAAKDKARRVKEMRLKDTATRSRANTADSMGEPYSPSVVEARFVFDQNGEFKRK